MSGMLESDEDARLQLRQKRLLKFVYLSTLIPLLVFGLLTWQSIELARDVAQKQDDLKMAQDTLTKTEGDLMTKREELAKTEQKLASQTKTAEYYRDAAGVKIRFYRESDRAMVQRALIDQGFKVDATLGKSQLVQDTRPNTLSYGSGVAREDLRAIAVALVSKGFPLTRIAPASVQPDPSLIQIIASREGRDNCRPLTVEMLQQIDFTRRVICEPK